MMKTSKEYSVRFKVAGCDYGMLTVPKGTKLTHMTASGIDKNYHFVADTTWIKPHKGGTKQYGLLHDLKYYGINVPKEYVDYDKSS